MIIDTHAHIGRILNFNMPEKNLLYSMDRYGIDFSLVSNIEAAEFDHKGRKIPFFLRRSQTNALLKTLELAREHPDRIGVLPWVRLALEKPEGDFVRLIEENRSLIYGFKLHPFHSRVAPDDDRAKPVYELARRFGLPVVSHTGGCAEAMSERLANAARQNPDINFVMVHMDLGTDNRRALELLGKYPNLYGDTTWVPVKTTVEAIRRFGCEKMLFGTDNPIDGRDTLLHNKTGDRSLYQEYFNELQALLSGEEYACLMYKNAERIFKIKGYKHD
jgi:predicted TIM-barrel fold metal-dependent hydrolase